MPYINYLGMMHDVGYQIGLEISHEGKKYRSSIKIQKILLAGVLN